jgi:hypothetical protein
VTERVWNPVAPPVTLTDFLLARIAEDEEAARESVGTRWHAQGGPELRTEAGTDPHWFQIATGAYDDGPDGYSGDSYWDRMRTFHHIARHDPARVLAECESKRRIVALAAVNPSDWGHHHGDDWGFAVESALCELAAVYADHPDHPDHRSEWAPERA